MKHFIFYTTEGQTQDDNGQDIENCQILDFQEAETLEDAVVKFREDYFALNRTDEYSFEEVLILETVDMDPVRIDIREEN